VCAGPKQRGLFAIEPEPAPWELAEGGIVARVVFNRPLDTAYHYLVPEELQEMILPGQRVRVPFGRGDTLTLGYCVGISTDPPTQKKLKTVRELCDREPLLSQAMLDLTEWISRRYLCSWGQVLESVVPAGVKKQSGTREILHFRIAEGIEEIDALKLPAKQRAIVEVLRQADTPLPVDALTEAVGCGTAPVQGLRKKGILVPERRRSRVADPSRRDAEPATTPPPDADSSPRKAPPPCILEPEQDLQLNREQQVCLDRILELIRAGEHRTALIHGVTGSGKTEVYIQAIREVVSYGRQAIVLVPEISLTPQTIRRFRARFPSVAVLHSHLSDSDRHWHWQQIAEGQVQVVVGARSAVFAPTPHLGLIVIDEEHETTFKQNSTPRYHAREVARERARREGVPLLLGSATPTLESLLRTRQGDDLLLTLKDRVERRPLPPVTLVDTRNDPLIAKSHAIGRAMGNAIQHALRDGGQVILFLNLRGYSPVLWCPRCTGIKCPDCDISLTWHKDRGVLLCHSCDHEVPPPERCPVCGQPGLRFIGTGTQRLEAEVRTKFPQAQVQRMDSDSMKQSGSHDRVLEEFRNGGIDILLGTQMIAKGLDFPNVTLVGVIDADTLLHQPDLRAAERTFQLIAQVAGRTGRGEKAGRVLVQTMAPDEPVIQLASRHDYNGFAKLELEHRRAMHAPPYASLARVILRAEEDSLVQGEARRIAALIRETADAEQLPVRLLGPAPAPITRLRKYFRYHFQLTASEFALIEGLWKKVAHQLKLHPDVELTIDVDPMDLR
jgi:primosomal protein N' (replication factor Y) (superfamily II helicase)